MNKKLKDLAINFKRYSELPFARRSKLIDQGLENASWFIGQGLPTDQLREFADGVNVSEIKGMIQQGGLDMSDRESLKVLVGVLLELNAVQQLMYDDLETLIRLSSRDN